MGTEVTTIPKIRDIGTGTYVGNDTPNRAIPHYLGYVPSYVMICSQTYVFVLGEGPVGGWRIICISQNLNYLLTDADAINFYVGSATSYPFSANQNTTPYRWYAFQ